MPDHTASLDNPEIVALTVGQAELHADLVIPKDPKALIIFAHGSGSSRFSKRNRFVASRLNDNGLATLLLDLLSKEEDQIDQRSREYRFNIPLLASRVVAAIDWAAQDKRTAALPVGTFGASTGAAAALIAAAERPRRVKAAVSRGGRPDLAEDALPRVKAPTLLIVGAADEPVIPLNEQARARMNCDVHLELVPAATHLFEEPGAIEKVADLAARFFNAQF